jgi:acyl carrier protein
MTTVQSYSRNEIRNFVRSTIAEIKGLDELPVSDDASLFDLEGTSEDDAVLDSLDVFDFGLALEERFDIGLPQDLDVTEFQTIELIVDFIERQVRERQDV